MSGELDEVLRENLKLRCKLAGEVAKAKGARVHRGIAYRLGWVLYWACLGLAVFWLAVWFGRFFTDLPPLPWLLHVLLFLLPALVLYGLSQALGYVLAGSRSG
jgi:NhaP-type Na+/H+ or K+/H+ antiporter